jgi:hypothetical protein
MRILDDWARRYHIAVLIPMHARKPHPQAGWKQFSMNDIGGNGAWVRNAEVVFGLQLGWSGFSRMWFFKDRDGGLPPIRTWWGLKFDRSNGFRHDPETEKAPAVDLIKPLIDNETGRSFDDLIAKLNGVVTERNVKSTLKRIAHENDAGLWRLAEWPVSQSSLLEMESVASAEGP